MNPILDIITGVTPIIGRLLDLIPDKNARQRAELEMQAALMKYAAEQGAQQAEINKAEAQHASLFVAGWRPAIGWACASAFIFIYVVSPIVTWIVAFWGVTISMPNFDTEALMSLTLGMLGLGAMRSFEKWHGVARK